MDAAKKLAVAKHRDGYQGRGVKWVWRARKRSCLRRADRYALKEGRADGA